MTTLLLEPFESKARWSLTGTETNWSIVAGRNGNCVRAASSGDWISYGLGIESADVTVGVAFQVSALPGPRYVLQLCSDSGVTDHLTVRVNTNGSLNVCRGNISGTVLGTTTAAGLIAINTWYYIEIQATLSDTVGKVELKLNGSTVIGPLTSQDTKNGGTKTVFDAVRLTTSSAAVQMWDDCYIKVGAGETFLGSTAVATVTDRLLARQSTRVAVVTPGAARNYRQQLRVGISLAPPEARLARISSRLLTTGAPAAQLARVSLRALTSLATGGEARLARISLRALTAIVALGATAKYWNGSAFADGPVKTWDGTAFVDAVGVKTWNGSAFV